MKEIERGDGKLMPGSCLIFSVLNKVFKLSVSVSMCRCLLVVVKVCVLG